MNAITNEGRTLRRIARVEPDSALVVERYLLDNGSHEVVLVDDTEETWEKYCRELASRTDGSRK